MPLFCCDTWPSVKGFLPTPCGTSSMGYKKSKAILWQKELVILQNICNERQWSQGQLWCAYSGLKGSGPCLGKDEWWMRGLATLHIDESDDWWWKTANLTQWSLIWPTLPEQLRHHHAHSHRADAALTSKADCMKVAKVWSKIPSACWDISVL